MTEENHILQGIAASPGIVVARAQVLTEAAQISTRLLYTEKDVAEEQERFRDVVDQIEAELAQLKDEISEDLKEHAHILELHLLILRERMFYADTLKLIQEQHLNAERALHQAYLKIKELFQRIGDKHIRGRLADVEMVYRRVMGRLTGKDTGKSFSFKEPVIVVARDLSPAETTQMSKSQVLGFVTERGGKTSHTAIIAHSLEIPAVVGLDNATVEIESGDLIILDGISGMVILNPDDSLRRIYQARRADFEIFKSEVVLGSAMPAATSDGLPTRVMANIEMAEETSLASKYGADGVGLYRTEFLYLQKRHLPTEEELFQDYKQVVEAQAPRVVTIRTLDIGGDKFLSPLEYAPEMNPALGLRAIRFCLKEQKIFRTQLKAILRASAYGQVRVMFPLISSPGEMQEARQLLESVKKELKKEKIAFDAKLPVGAMIEVPAAVTLADLLTKYADFFSIGTNDLIQYALAIDRVNQKVADMYQPLHPAVLRMVRDVVQVGRQAGISVAMCGEMAGDPLYIPVLLGLGVEEFSMNTMAIPVAKRVIRMTKLSEAKEIARKALQLHTVGEVNNYVTREMDRRFPDIFRFGRPLANKLGK
ncbi:MAG: phosphoenolpyruvate--protein phosphotransferase [Deltaproteobacteria bacterium]|nr:phosphoenolpyruvate--protein phosphotransferase [Deltaproteobacteria bacterium]